MYMYNVRYAMFCFAVELTIWIDPDNVTCAAPGGHIAVLPTYAKQANSAMGAGGDKCVFVDVFVFLCLVCKLCGTIIL